MNTTKAKPKPSLRPRASRGKARPHAPHFGIHLSSLPKALPGGAVVLLTAAVALLAVFHLAHERLKASPQPSALPHAEGSTDYYLGR